MTTQATSRERLLTAAAELFYERGVQGTSVQAVVDAAGLTRPTLYAHFDSKDTLLEAVLVERHERRIVDLARAEAAAGPDVRAQLLSVFDWLDEHYRLWARRGCGFLNVAAEQGGSSAAMRSVADHKQWMYEHLTEHARVAGLAEPEQIGRQLLLLVDGVGGFVVANPDATAQETSAVVAAARQAAESLADAGLHNP